MIKVLKDNTVAKYYTKCKSCNSELEYEYGDVCFEDIPYSFMPNRTITCPACNKITLAELTEKAEYSASLPFVPNLANGCCGLKAGDDL